MSTIIQKSPGQSSDDVQRSPPPDYWSMVAALEVGYTNSTYYAQGCGIRFPNVTVPQGNTIVAAYLTLKCSYSRDANTVNSRISAEKVDDAPTFADDAAAFDARWANRTTARVDWDAIPAWTAGVSYNSPDIKSVIQEIIDRPGWASGQAIVIFWEDFEDRSTHASNVRRTAYAWDYGSGANKAILTIEYEPPGVTHELAGVINGVASVLGLIKPLRGIATSTAGVASVSGATKISKTISGASNGIASIVGALINQKWLTGIVSGVASISGATKILKKISGAVSGEASVAGVLTKVTEILLAGVATGIASVSGAVKVLKKMSGVTTGVASVTGSLINQVWLAGLSAGASTVSGFTSVLRKIAGTVAGVASVDGIIKISRGIAGIAAGVASAAGSLTVIIVRILELMLKLKQYRQLTINVRQYREVSVNIETYRDVEVTVQ